MNVYAVVMAGGAGTRFWPASRRARPKQLLPLASDKPLLVETLARIAPLCPLERTYVATGEHLREATLKAVPSLSAAQLLVEPVPRNTAPCIGWAAATVARSDPDAVVMALPSDAWIRDEQAYRDTLQVAIDHAATGAITTIGISPTHPEVGYGYIEAAADSGAVRAVARFVEKPDLESARRYVASGRFFWNAGMFFFRAGDMLAAIEHAMPKLRRGLNAFDEAARQGREAEAVASGFADLPAVSIDHGVMEKVAGLAVVPGDFGWTDLGSWDAVAELAAAEGAGAPASSILIDSPGCHVSDDQPGVVALVGVEDLVVVRTGDAVLVMRKSASQKVREVVARLRDQGREDLT